jgi:hypothetical protein
MSDVDAWHNLEREFLEWKDSELSAETSGLEGEADRWTLHGDGKNRFGMIAHKAAEILGHSGEDSVNFWIDQVCDYLRGTGDENLEHKRLHASARAASPEGVDHSGGQEAFWAAAHQRPPGPEKRIECYEVRRLFRASADYCMKLDTDAKAAKGNRPRQGYRTEVRKWMKDKQVKTIEDAAKRLHIGSSTLKSIMTSRGKKRYGEQTLKDVLEKIGHTLQ